MIWSGKKTVPPPAAATWCLRIYQKRYCALRSSKYVRLFLIVGGFGAIDTCSIGTESVGTDSILTDTCCSKSPTREEEGPAILTPGSVTTSNIIPGEGGVSDCGPDSDEDVYLGLFVCSYLLMGGKQRIHLSGSPFELPTGTSFSCIQVFE